MSDLLVDAIHKKVKMILVNFKTNNVVFVFLCLFFLVKKPNAPITYTIIKLSLTVYFGCSLFIPPENIRKPTVFLLYHPPPPPTPPKTSENLPFSVFRGYKKGTPGSNVSPDHNLQIRYLQTVHCVKSDRIQRFSGPYFSAFSLTLFAQWYTFIYFFTGVFS